MGANNPRTIQVPYSHIRHGWHEDGVKHRDLRACEIVNSEAAVIRTMAAFSSYMNPFSPEVPSERLVILSSGSFVSADVQKDVLRAEKAGKRPKRAS